MSNSPDHHRRRRCHATPVDGFGAATDEDLRALVTSELPGFAAPPRLLSRGGSWATFVADERGGGPRVIVNVRSRTSVDHDAAEHLVEVAVADRAEPHPAVLHVRNCGRTERLLWTSLPEMGGRLLGQWFSEERVPSAGSALELLRHVAAPLVALHSAGRVHGALTPWAFHRDSSGVVRICCPGVELVLLRADLAIGVESEAVAFAAPEIVAGREAHAGADQYGLAAILVKLSSGRVAIPGEDLPPEVPERWAPCLRRALDRDPHARWPSVRELVERLDPESLASAGSWPAGGPGAAPGVEAAYRPSWMRRRGDTTPRVELGREDAPLPDDLQILFPPAVDALDVEDEEEEELPRSESVPVEGGSRGRRLLRVSLLLLLGGAVGVAYAGGSASLVPRAFAATLDDWVGGWVDDGVGGWVDDFVDNWYAWAPIGERLDRAPSQERGTAAGSPDGTAASEEEAPREASSDQTAVASSEASPGDPTAAGQVAVAPAPAENPPRGAPAVGPGPASSTRQLAASDSEPTAGLGPSGRLSLQSYPWGAVYIDGIFVGNTPLLDVRLPAGDHAIRIERPPYDPFSIIATVEPGQTLRLTGIVLTGGGR